MNIHARYTALSCATLAGLLMLSACGKSEQETSPPPAAPAATAPAPAASPAIPATTPPPAATAPAPSSTAMPAPASSSGKSASSKPVSEIKVAAVSIGSAVDAAHAINKEQRRFTPDDKAIYASVATVGSTDGATLSARWSYVENNGQSFNNTSESIATSGPATTTFKVQNPNAWPVGKYKVEISLNGTMVASENFEVRT